MLLSSMVIKGSAPTCGEDHSHLQVARCEPDDRGFVQLGGDGGGQRQQFGQFIKLAVFLLPARPGRVFRLLLHVSASAPIHAHSKADVSLRAA